MIPRTAKLLTCLLIFIFGFSSLVHAEDSTKMYGFGSISKNEDVFSFAVGSRDMDFGMEFGLIDTAEYPYTDYLDYPCPHSDYIELGNKRVEPTNGIDLVGFLNLSDNLSLYGGFGLYWQKLVAMVRSNTTGYLYAQDLHYEFDSAYTYGIQFTSTSPSNITSSGILIGVGFHSLRGYLLQVGWKN